MSNGLPDSVAIAMAMNPIEFRHDGSVICLLDLVRVEKQQGTTMKARLSILAIAATSTNMLVNGPAAAAPSIDGIWEPARVAGVAHPQPEDVGLTPEGRAEFERFSEERDPTLKCIMPGVPLGIHDPYPLEIVQQDHQIVFLHEHFHMVRRIFMDGRQAPENWWPSLVGFSVGSWEGDTLVVKTTHMSPENLMWHNGMPFSGDPETYVIERYDFDGDEFSLTAEVYDPRYYEEPYVIRSARTLAPDGMILEYECYPEYSGF